ncbi:hypothetical protein SLEP1_g22857 [Rubroshorea leprosula]|uniref:Uncharacterized protein n=1 Tax=Rubroshorea leprosula TaxID=152421 RepID=A0AAV5JHS2_9ROSI|nr:hypothetical protein SLEP1_g22857 [Rubroshorea leprosula]
MTIFVYRVFLVIAIPVQKLLKFRAWCICGILSRVYGVCRASDLGSGA